MDDTDKTNDPATADAPPPGRGEDGGARAAVAGSSSPRRIQSQVRLSAEDLREIDSRWPEGADTAQVAVEDGWLAVRYVKSGQRFERIRRITGYLVGTLDKWNDAKRAEERDRVKHAIANEGRGCAANEGPACGGNEGRPSAE